VAPLLAATVVVEFSIALMGKLSPQLPVLALTVPAKNLAGTLALVGSLALWPAFLEGRFAWLLDRATALAMAAAGGR
jgi:flagellar biosynthetic protein FliR